MDTDATREDLRARLDATLQAALLYALASEWETLNYQHFRNRLRAPTFVLGDSAQRLGQWSPIDRTVEISRRLVVEQPWGVVVEVLKHEMAHQYAHEVLGATDESAHGAAFRATCERLGIDAAATGLPSAAAGRLAAEDERVLARIAKLLALAGSPERHEAEAAMREAQRLMLKHNVDAAAAGRRSPYGFRHLGEPTGRLQAHQRLLAAILNSHFFVETIWVPVYQPLVGKRATVLEVCGTEPNLEMAGYVHDYLLRAAERLWAEHKRAHRIRADRDRRSYLSGVMRGFSRKLDEERTRSREAGLVWLGDGDLTRYYEQRYPRRRSAPLAARAQPAAFAAGERAGRTLVIHRPVESGPSAAGRLLPAARR